MRNILADIRRDDLRASEVIQRVRALVNRQEARFETFDVEPLVRRTAEFIAQESKQRGVEITFDIKPGIPPLVADRGQLEQALLNLLLNAMDAMEGTPVARRKIDLRAGLDGTKQIRITVSDRGTGIDPGNGPRLFDSFFSTKEGGMGLGLALVHSIAELHGGSAMAENNASGGADFHLLLPLPRS